MEAESENQDSIHYEDDEQRTSEIEDYATTQPSEQKQEPPKTKNDRLDDSDEGRSSFIDGLSVGLGVGCVATFVIVWIAVFFTPQMPSTITYESLLSVFIYPLIYLLTVGLIALTAGVVREYYVRRKI
jgi:hypothetical protein